jgi:polysaccharide export outer membrane protein
LPRLGSLSLVLAAALATSGCFLPTSGPSSAITDTPAGETPSNIGYLVYDLNAQAAALLHVRKQSSLRLRFGNKHAAPAQRVSIGDKLVVSIWEAGSGGLFSPPAGQFVIGTRNVTLPPQTVDKDGSISVPYAGRISVRGSTPAEISRQIEARLAGKAIEPQAIVTIQESSGTSVTVIGEVTGGGRVPVTPKGDRILEVIAQAGGVKSLPHETFIRVLRGSASEVVLMQDVLSVPGENIFVQPGDTIYVHRDPQTFTAFGAVSAQKDYPIDQTNMTLADAIAKAGGLIDVQADSSAVFLFRFEDPRIVRQLRPDAELINGGAGGIPIIYRLNMRDPSGLFMAQKVSIRNKDAIFVANAGSTDFLKFLTIVRAIATTAGAIRNSGNTVFTAN